MRRQLLVFASALAIAGCSETPRVVPPPAPPPRPVPAPAPAPAPAPSPVPQGPDWRDWPLTPGDWVYRQDGRGSVAFFGVAGGEAELILRCDAGRGRVVLSRKGEGVASVTVRTTSTLRQIAVQPLSGAAPRLAAEFAPADPLLDAMGYSRGRFLVQGNGLPTLVVPAYAEVLRVAEDCRG
ncbi:MULTISPECIES: hypothetical protein [Sphingomonas]|uniref:Lipoprotein n=1 Tax=Sphingomonas leidyi TaxID=68569 RepID=A0A7X5ZX79_9SPHN|nr:MULTISPECIES: hypothetical protein [Sphingomonas]MBN8813481.1 hypothetical protein [Sphingomonas sp.]NIJ66957.1 hypothetical protein [Sphingomonas leidyi]OJY52459.1 MAG: hypothetical protein BGP17_08450 [Sphingomonas sp. 67-41]